MCKACSELKIYRLLEKVNQDDDVDHIFNQSQLFGLRFALGCVDISILQLDMQILDISILQDPMLTVLVIFKSAQLYMCQQPLLLLVI